MLDYRRVFCCSLLAPNATALRISATYRLALGLAVTPRGGRFSHDFRDQDSLDLAIYIYILIISLSSYIQAIYKSSIILHARCKNKLHRCNETDQLPCIKSAACLALGPVLVLSSGLFHLGKQHLNTQQRYSLFMPFMKALGGGESEVQQPYGAQNHPQTDDLNKCDKSSTHLASSQSLGFMETEKKARTSSSGSSIESTGGPSSGSSW